MKIVKIDEHYGKINEINKTVEVILFFSRK